MVTPMDPILVVLDVLRPLLEFVDEARLKEDRPFSSGGASEQTH